MRFLTVLEASSAQLHSAHLACRNPNTTKLKASPRLTRVVTATSPGSKTDIYHRGDSLYDGVAEDRK